MSTILRKALSFLMAPDTMPRAFVFFFMGSQFTFLNHMRQFHHYAETKVKCDQWMENRAAEDEKWAKERAEWTKTKAAEEENLARWRAIWVKYQGDIIQKALEQERKEWRGVIKEMRRP